MKTVIRMDEKGRIHVPNKIRKTLGLGSNQLISVEVRGEDLVFRAATKLKPQTDSVLRDILQRPGRNKIRLTKELLDKMREEVWNP